MINATNKNAKQSIKNTLLCTKYMLSVVAKEEDGKSYFIISTFKSMLETITPLIYIIFPGLLLNELVGDARLNILAVFVSAITILPLIISVINFIANQRLQKIGMSIELSLEKKYHNHVLNMDYASVESPDVQIKNERAGQAYLNALNIINQVCTLFSSVIRFCAMITIILILDPVVIIIIILAVLANSQIEKRLNAKIFSVEKEIDNLSNYEWTYGFMLKNISYAKEIRIFNIKSFLINLYVENREKILKLRLVKYNNRTETDIIKSVIHMVQQIFVYTFLIYYVVVRGLAIGSMTIFLATASQFSSTITAITRSYLGLSSTALHTLEVIDFFDKPYAKTESRNKAPVFTASSVIEFKNVSFKYPGSNKFSLRDFSLKLHGNEKLCIVGANGAGKSTFVKLLTRLYEPTSGEILLNGINICKYDYDAYQQLFSPVFQDFNMFSLTVMQNIMFDKTIDTSFLNSICSSIGLKQLIMSLPKGYETQVGKWLDDDGFDPSGGEEQRIAIARAIYYNAPIFILDEPTAALDPLAESEIYTQFNSTITDKAAVIITHRLSAVQLADKVAVFNNGSIVEYGTHQELYKAKRLYAEMFDNQASFYLDNGKENV